MNEQDVFPLGWYLHVAAGTETDVDVCERGRTGAAFTGIPCEEVLILGTCIQWLFAVHQLQIGPRAR